MLGHLERYCQHEKALRTAVTVPPGMVTPPSPWTVSGRSVQKAGSITCSRRSCHSSYGSRAPAESHCTAESLAGISEFPSTFCFKSAAQRPRTNSKAPPRQGPCLTCRSRTAQKANKHKSAHLGRRSTCGSHEDALNARASRLS